MIFLVSGCRSAFQPPPDSFERWRKEDTFVQQVMAVLLECGYPWPGSSVGDWGKAYGGNMGVKYDIGEKVHGETRIC